MSSPSPENHSNPDHLPVTIELFLHWQCPHCQFVNAIPLPENLPKFVTCSECAKVSRTLMNE